MLRFQDLRDRHAVLEIVIIFVMAASKIMSRIMNSASVTEMYIC